MIRVGLTGSIASGKSTVSSMFERLGAAVFNADAAVHILLEQNDSVKNKVIELFPESWAESKIHRQIIGKIVFHQPDKLQALESILHPAVHEMEAKAISLARLKDKPLIVCDIPLLFETHADKRMDVSLLVTCPTFIQRQRALKRPHMTQEKFEAILSKQMPVYQKRKLADFEIHTGLGKAHSFKEVNALYHHLLQG